MTSSCSGPRTARGTHAATTTAACGAALLLAALLAGCTAARPAGPREYLDERTAATITVAGPGTVFAYDRPELGVNARDYVTLTAVDVNLSGQHTLHIVGYAWSTLDKRFLDEGDSRYEIVAADRTLPLVAAPAGFHTIGLDEPPIPVPSRGALPLSAPVTRELMQYVLDTPGVRVLRTRAGIQERFEVWHGRGG